MFFNITLKMEKLENVKDYNDLSFKELKECYKILNKYKKLFIAVGKL